MRAVVGICDPVLRRLLVLRQLSLWRWRLLQALRPLIQGRCCMSLGRRSESSASSRLLTGRFLVRPWWFSPRAGRAWRHLVHRRPLHIPLVVWMTELLWWYLWLLDFRQTMLTPVSATATQS